MHKVPPGLTTSDKSSSTSIRDENDESDSLSIATAHGPDTRDNRHTSLYIADELKAVINDLGPQKVFALVTDNAVNMKAAWSKVEESYPHITPIGCAAHALNLLLKYMMALKTMDTLYKRAKEMVRYVKGHQVIATIYLTKQSENNMSTILKLPSNTHWGEVVIMFDRLLEGKESLQ